MHRSPIILVVSALAFSGVPILAQQQAPPPAKIQTPQAVIPKSAQDQKPTTDGATPDAKPAAPCVILKRMGPADEITSHLYSFGIRGKQFQYVEGKLPEGFPFHGRLTDHDVRNLQGRGAEVVV